MDAFLVVSKSQIKQHVLRAFNVIVNAHYVQEIELIAHNVATQLID